MTPPRRQSVQVDKSAFEQHPSRRRVASLDTPHGVAPTGSVGQRFGASSRFARRLRGLDPPRALAETRQLSERRHTARRRAPFVIDAMEATEYSVAGSGLTGASPGVAPSADRFVRRVARAVEWPAGQQTIGRRTHRRTKRGPWPRRRTIARRGSGAARAAVRPNTTPTPTGIMPCRTTSVTTLRTGAPSDRRMPISAVRSATK